MDFVFSSLRRAPISLAWGRVPLNFVAFGCLAVASALLASPNAQAYTPEDPVVQAMVERGLKFIEKNPPADRGETVLCAYAHFKVEHDESNPVVTAGIAQAKRFANELAQTHAHKGTYEAAVSALRRDGDLREELTEKAATDVLWALLSVSNWRLWTMECGWSVEDYRGHIQRVAESCLVRGS